MTASSDVPAGPSDGGAKIPQPRPKPLIGNATDVEPATVLQSMLELAKEYGPIYRLEFPGQSLIALSSHALAAEICDETRFHKAVHGPLRQLRPLAGDGLFTAYDEEPNWGKAHRLLMPAFGPAAMRDYFDDMLELADQMLTKWRRFGPDAVIDVPDNMTRLTLDTIALSGFGYRFNSFYRDEMHPFVEAMVGALKEAGARGRRLAAQNWLMRGTRLRFEADIHFMHSVTDALIAARRAMDSSSAPRDLLGLMLSAKDPVTGEGLDDENIRYQLVTFLIAGHETTSGLLSFAIYLLLGNPDALARARDQVDAVIGAGTPRFEDMARLGYIDQVLRETLRLYPTAPAFGVWARQPTTIGGRWSVPADETLLVLLPALHRDPAVWKDPERFDPDRFAPEAHGAIPAHAWMPFGNGARSCIGRAFAMQEATLVLAMVLQRFDIAFAEPYRLMIRETLTLKPADLHIHARPRDPASRVAPLSFRTDGVRDGSPPTAASPGHVMAIGPDAPTLLALYGSNSGASEAFARRIAGDAAARGYAAEVAPLDGRAGDLPASGTVVVVTASYNGEPPDNARRFARWIADEPPGSLAGLRFAVFGCGNRDWAETYQAVPRALEGALARAGAEAILPRGEADARADFFGDFEAWYASFWGALGAGTDVGGPAAAQGPLYEVEIAPAAIGDFIRRNRLDYVTVLENRELVDMTSPFGRSKRHLEFALPDGAAYAAGDYLAVLPENHPELIARAARRFDLRPDTTVILHSTRGAMAASLPTGRPVSLHELLGCYVELAQPATRRDIAALADAARCPPDRDALRALADDAERYQPEILEKRVSVLDLLERHPSCAIPFAAFLELLPAMRVRQYSIASSPLARPGGCALTVAVVDGPAWSGIGAFHGLCSSYLARRRAGDRVAAAIRTPNVPFRPPASNATPMVMICAGTGIAPFRGFVEERALRQRAGEPAGEALLFFGCDHPDVDFLYREELAGWRDEGVVTIFPAYFRQPDGEIIFVQHRLWQERARVRELLARDATIYLCGDGLLMAPAVRQTLARIHQEESGGTEAEAEAWLRGLEREGRFVPDVFG